MKTKRIFWAWGAVAWMALAIQANAAPVFFADDIIEARVRFLIEKPTGTIDDSDLLDITEFDVSGFGVFNLGGIEALVNLTSIDLSGNFIADIAPLVGLDQLTHVDLSTNLIEDLSPAEGSNLGSVEFLDLADNLIVSIESLAGLESLVDLNLANNLIADLFPLLDNDGLGSGDSLDVLGNPLAQASVCNVILSLVARGVAVAYEGECAGVINGLVIDQTSGNPVPGAFVYASAPLVAPGIGPVSFDGEFFIEGLASGDYDMTVFAPGYERDLNFVEIANSELIKPTFRINRITRTNVVRVAGFVTSGATGLPLAGVAVEAFNVSTPIDATYTNSVGRFELLIPTTITAILSVEFSAPGFDDEDAALNPANDDDINASMTPRSFPIGILQGTVLNGGVESLPGLPGARVILKQTGGTVAFGASSDGNGNFTISNLAPGEYSIHVSSLHYPDEGKLRTLTISGNSNTFEITIGTLPDGSGCVASAGSASSSGPGDAIVLVAFAMALAWASRGSRARAA